MNPLHDLKSTISYALHPGAIDFVISEGKILKEDGKVKNKEEVVENAKKCARKLCGKG